MDLLDDVLKLGGLRSRIINQRVFIGATALTFPCTKSLGFHVVTQGRAFIHSPELDLPIQLGCGDVALMARGCDHIVATEETLAANVVTVQSLDHHRHPAKAVDNTKSKLTLVSGAYQLWNTPVHPFFDELPRWYVMRSNELDHFDDAELAIKMLASETARQEVGADRVGKALLDIIFTHIIRKILKQRGLSEKTWSHALQNAPIKRALELMHEDSAFDWTLDDLARRVNLSRSGFAQKFKATVGNSPFQYLTTLRVQKAMSLLSGTSDKLESVSQAVGYKDAFNFSKAFKKATGLPPQQFRTQNRLAEQQGMRF